VRKVCKIADFFWKQSSPFSTTSLADPALLLSSGSGMSTATSAAGRDNVDDGRLTPTSGDVITEPPYCFRSAAVDTFISDRNCRDADRARFGSGGRRTRSGFDAAEVLNSVRRLGHRNCLAALRVDEASSRRIFFSRSSRL